MFVLLHSTYKLYLIKIIVQKFEQLVKKFNQDKIKIRLIKTLTLLFFSDTDKYPLSIFLSKINAGEVGLAFAVATVYMVPSLLIFLYGEEQLVEGIAYQGGVKG